MLFNVMFLMYTCMFASPAIPPFEELLRNEIHYPQYAKDAHEEGIVLVCFCIDSNGKIILKESNSDNELLKNYVLNKLASIKLPVIGSQDEEYNMKFVFRLL